MQYISTAAGNRLQAAPVRPGSTLLLAPSRLTTGHVKVERNVAAKFKEGMGLASNAGTLSSIEIPGSHWSEWSPGQQLHHLGRAASKLTDVQTALKLLKDNTLLVTSMGAAEPRRECMCL